MTRTIADLDVQVTDHGSLVGFRPLSDAAIDWFEENVASEDWQWLGRSLNVDHRFASSLIEGISDAGLVV